MGSIEYDTDRTHEISGEPLLWINSVDIDPIYRKQGFGKMLVYAAILTTPGKLLPACFSINDVFWEHIGFRKDKVDPRLHSLDMKCGDAQSMYRMNLALFLHRHYNPKKGVWKWSNLSPAAKQEN